MNEAEEWAAAFLRVLSEEKLRALLKVCALITDPLSQELMRKAAEVQSSASTTNKEVSG